jgi:hypothetical protein
MREKLLINSGGLAMSSPATNGVIKNPLQNKGMEISSSTAKKGTNGKLLRKYSKFFRSLIFHSVFQWLFGSQRLILVTSKRIRPGDEKPNS